MATLKTLLASDLTQEVKAKEALFLKYLVHPKIHAVRSAGLWLAVELRDAASVQVVIKACVSMGLITDWFLFNDKSLRIAPPLTISEAEIEAACRILLRGLERLEY